MIEIFHQIIFLNISAELIPLSVPFVLDYRSIFPRWIQFASGPTNRGALYCNLQSMFGQMFIVQSLLLLDSVILFKYIFIFVIGKPMLIMDDFWVTFLNIWIVGFSFSAQGILTFFQSGAQHINFYICTGLDAAFDIGTPLKFRGVMVINSTPFSMGQL